MKRRESVRLQDEIHDDRDENEVDVLPVGTFLLQNVLVTTGNRQIHDL
jgi:hypothetical protein